MPTVRITPPAKNTVLFLVKCGFSALVINQRSIENDNTFFEAGVPMRKLLVAICSIVLAFGLAGCVGKGKAPYVGKGKAPAPVVTKG